MQDRIDLVIDSDGDLVVDEDGDLKLATAMETVQQDIKFRAMTGHHDYKPDPFIGANLVSFQGKPNTRRTGDYMKAALYESLVRDGRFDRAAVFVDAVPVSRTQIALPVFIREWIPGLEPEIYNNEFAAVVTFTVALDTGQITAITGGLR